MTKIVGIIPCHLDSIRLKRKVLLDLQGLPMLEHVRRRALKSKFLKDVFIATGDKEIISIMKNFGSKIIVTKKKHNNGTTRVAEAINKIKSSHVILIQGDEPLLNPNYIDKLYQCILNDSKTDSWNLTAPLTKNELNVNNIVKCEIDSGLIISLFRKTNFFKQNYRKILGIIAYRSSVLEKLVQIKPSPSELKLCIEQLRIIENNFILKSVKVHKTLQSINVKSDVSKVKQLLKKNKITKF